MKIPPHTAFAMMQFQRDIYRSSMGKTDLVDIDDEGRVGSGGVGYPPAETRAQRAAMAAAAGENGGGDEDDDEDDDDEDDGDYDGGPAGTKTVSMRIQVLVVCGQERSEVQT